MGEPSGASTAEAGPESPTLAERVIIALGLPYAIGCAFVGFVLLGVPNTIVSQYAIASDPGLAVAAAFTVNTWLQYSLVAYAFYAPRYMRTKLLEAGHSLSALLPDRDGGFRRTFAGVSSRRPQVATWILFLIALIVALNTAAIMGTGRPTIEFHVGGEFSLPEFLAAIYDIVAIALATLALSSVVWTYWSISAGIRRFGLAPLELRPYHEDSFLGLRPVGSLALSLATVYFAFIGLLALVLATSPNTPTIGDLVGVGGFLFGLVLLGLALFFVPLNRLHRRMLMEKQVEKGGLGPKLRAIFQDSEEAGPDRDLASMFRLDMMDRKIAAMATWPFDIGILGRLSVIAVSVTAILIARIIAFLLHF